MFPGATLPFGESKIALHILSPNVEQGMAKAVADINDPNEKQGGFASGNSDITGFSHMHDSGTGGVRMDLMR